MCFSLSVYVGLWFCFVWGPCLIRVNLGWRYNLLKLLFLSIFISQNCRVWFVVSRDVSCFLSILVTFLWHGGCRRASTVFRWFCSNIRVIEHCYLCYSCFFLPTLLKNCFLFILAVTCLFLYPETVYSLPLLEYMIFVLYLPILC